MGNIGGYCIQEGQKEREAQLKVLLLERIERYVKGDKVGFVTWAHEEANQLAEAGEYMYKETEIERLMLSMYS